MINLYDEVALSATFLRSMGTLSFGGHGSHGVSTYDLGTGYVIGWAEGDPLTNLAIVYFTQRKIIRTFNVFNLIHRRDIHLDAMRAEHSPKNSA